MNPFLTGAMLVMSGLTGATPDQKHAPIYLETEVIGDDINVRVIGNADSATDATYTLAVSSGGAGSNRSVQSGRARLEPNRAVTLINLRLGRASANDWSAKLEVTPASAPSYTQEEGPKG